MLPYSEENSITFIHLLKLVSVISLKHEANRVDLYHAGIFNSMGKIFTYELNNKTLIQLCKTIRNFTVDDDPRQTTCRAHDNARDLVNDEQALEQLCKFLKNTDSSSFICKKEIILTLSKLLVRNEFCLKVAQDECGLINLIRENLIICLKLEKEATGDSSEKLNESASTTATATSTADSKNNEITLLRPLLLLLKAMCGNDEVKYQVSQTENMIENIVSNFTKYMANVAIVDGAITCLQMLTLRQVAVVNQLIKLSVPHLLIQAIQIHGDNRRVILNGAYLIRNLVARTRENQKFFINLDIESILNKLIGDFKNDTNVYQAIRAAQRDLDLDAGLKEQWTGAPGASKELEYD